MKFSRKREALIRRRRLIEVSDIIGIFVMYIFASVPQKSQNDPVFFEELHNITPSPCRPAVQGWLDQQILTTICGDGRSAVLEQVEYHLHVIEHDQN